MKNVIEISKKIYLDDDDLIKTNQGWVKAKNLKVNNKIFNFEGEITKITKIKNCGKRPDAPIIRTTTE